MRIAAGGGRESRGRLADRARDSATVAEVTDAALSFSPLDRQAPWVAGELAYWRWQAGLRDEPACRRGRGALRPVDPAGDWERAAERWREIGLPEAALAMADKLSRASLRRSVEDLYKGAGARPASKIVASPSAPAGRAACCAGRIRGREATPPA